MDSWWWIVDGKGALLETLKPETLNLERPSVSQSRSLECQPNPVTIEQKFTLMEGPIVNEKRR